MYITGLQMLHGIGLDSETRHHLDPNNSDEYLGDTQDWFPQGTTLVNPENDMVEAIEAGPLTTFDEYALAMAIHEFNTPVDSDTTPVETTPVTDTTKEDSTMSQSKTNTDQFRLILSSDEIGTRLHAQPMAHDDNTPSKPKSQLSHIQSVLLPFQAQGPMNAKLVAQMANAMQTVCFRDNLDADHPISLARLAAQEIFSSLRNNGKQIYPKSWINALNRGPRVRSMTFDAFCDLVTNATGATRVELDALKAKAEARSWKTVRVNSNLIAA